MLTLKQLLNTLPQTGTIEWIGIRSERRAPMSTMQSVSVSPAVGLEGDRYQGRTGERHVTLVQAEHLAAIASFSGRDIVSPEDLRRNILVRGINLLALKNQRILIGDVELEVTGLCHPCSRMEETLGSGGYNAMRGHGGITARVLSAGRITLGNSLKLQRVE